MSHSSELALIDRSALISEVYRWIDEDTHEDEDDPTYRPGKLATALAVLNSYSTELLTLLHDAAIARDTSYFMMARGGKDEIKLKTFIKLAEEYAYLFEGRLHNVCQINVAVESLKLYPALLREDSVDYYAKAVALTGVVTTIQHVLSETEGEYVQGNGRFLSYFPSNDDYFMNERLVRVTSEKLVSLILSHPEDWQRIADIVTKRETDDAEIIRYLLESEGSDTLTEGKL